MLGILLMILAFVALVVIHERGHMTAAKKIGVKVTEFGIGIPPRVATIGKDTS
ncbi:MAG: site-2 protease family protein [Candidatus Peribacteria bacterium]|nr:MAG: site-2 protease family protein [Candidatus Peribacteria bacterium]